MPDRRGHTALHHAVRRRLPDKVLRLLVQRGADVRAAANDGTTVGELATRVQRRLLGID
jgi:ankyrin repeat protein